MIDLSEVLETNRMVEEENLDVRTITLGISLLDCADDSVDACCEKIYNKITTIPIVHKRISVTPISLIGASCCHTTGDFVKIAQTLDRAAAAVGVNFLGGFSALVSKGMTPADELLIRSIPQALATTDLVCSSVNVGSTNVGSTKNGLNMDAVKLMGEIVRQAAEASADRLCIGPAKLVVFCNAPDDNPFMAGAFHGVSEGNAVVNVGVSGPGVVKYALEQMDRRARENGGREANFETLCQTIKKTAFKITRVGQYVAQEASRRLGALCCRHLEMHRCGAAGCARHHRCLSLAQRPGEEGRYHGQLLCRRTLRSLHPRQRGSGHDRRGQCRSTEHRETRSHDLRLLGRTRHDRHPR